MTDKRVLLIEDNADDRDLTVLAFKKNGVLHSVAVAVDGAEALTMLFGDGHEDPDIPALILLDLKLAKVDGLEVLRRIRAGPRTRLVPVVILTSSMLVEDLRGAYALGASGYVHKPVEFSEFVEVIRTVSGFWLLLNQPPPEPQL
jgi:two-component system response regulator